MREDQKAVFDGLRPRLQRACRAYLGVLHTEADDIVNDALMLSGPTLDCAAPLESNASRLQQVCRQLCGARLRSRDGVLRCLEPELDRVRRSRALQPVASDNLEVQKQAGLSLLREAIKPLSLEGRQMLQLRNVKGLSYAEIALTLQLSWKGVAEGLAKAREEMHASIGPSLVETVPSSLTRGPWGLQPA
jgi:RNA polymerase sigma-70 factor (ECF subfamily)